MSHKTFAQLLGPFLFVTIIFLPPFDSLAKSAVELAGDTLGSGDIARVVFSMKVVLALLCLMIIWWLSEAVPLPITVGVMWFFGSYVFGVLNF